MNSRWKRAAGSCGSALTLIAATLMIGQTVHAPPTISVVASGAPLINPSGIAMSSDGATLYVSDFGAKAVFAIPSGGGAPSVVSSFDTTGFNGFNDLRFLTISPDGSTLYVAGWGTGTVFSIDVASGVPTYL